MTLRRARDQIKGLADNGRKRRVKLLHEENNIDELFNFAYRPSSFELKFNKISEENIRYFQDLLTILARKTDICFTALVIDRKDPAYKHRTLLDMYKIITHKYFNYRCKEKCIFAPDDFDTGLSWDQVVRSDKIAALMPMESHSSLALQCCDILSGTIGLALKDEVEYTNRDKVRLPMVTTFEQEFACKIKSNFTVNKPRYMSVWTLDFSKVRTK